MAPERPNSFQGVFMHRLPPNIAALQATARLVAICWARQLRDAGLPVPDLRTLTARVLIEVRR